MKYGRDQCFDTCDGGKKIGDDGKKLVHTSSMYKHYNDHLLIAMVARRAMELENAGQGHDAIEPSPKEEDHTADYYKKNLMDLIGYAPNSF